MAQPANTKTTPRITWPDGSTDLVIRRGRWWHWRDGRGFTCESSHLGNVIEQAAIDGGKVDRVPNPHYRPGKRVPDHLGRALLGDLWGY